MSKIKPVLGVVVESLAGARFRVQLEDGRVVIGYLAGKMKLRKVSVMIGDTVEIELDPYEGKASNRIVWRR